MTSPEVSCYHAPLNLEKRDELVLSHLTEVHFIARRIHERLPVFVLLEDLVHSGVLGLLEATLKFDSTRNIQFKTFAQFRIRGAILDSLRELESAPADSEESSFAQCLRSEMRQHLAQAMSNLSPRENQILSLYYFEQLTMQEIASILDLKNSRISQIHSAAIAKLRAHLEAKEISEDTKTGVASVPGSN
jgi:RNA polymerase sigma factor for flagellar operon FliA